MSDDTPTQRFPSNPDTPTQRLDTGEVQEDLQEEKQKSKGLLIGLVAAGGLLLLSIVVIAFVLLNRGQGEPTVAASDTPHASDSATPTPEASETPDASPTPTEDAPAPPPPAPSGPAITSFKVTPATVYCNTQAPVQPQNQYLSISWSTKGADEIRIGTYDPYGDYSVRYYDLPPNGDQGSIGQDIIYQCPEATQTWRLEIVADGQTYQKEVTIHNNGDQQ
jgi:hypothetical protein